MSNLNVNSLNSFKEQIASILKEIDSFGVAEKTEALTFLQNCISTDSKNEKSIMGLQNLTTTTAEDQDAISSTVNIAPLQSLKCIHCDKSFKRKCDLTRHLSVHSDVKPYVCTTCDNSFKHKGQLLKHEQTAHQYREKQIKHLALTPNMDEVQNSFNLKQTESNYTSNENDSSNNVLTNSISTNNKRSLRNRKISFKPKFLEKFSNTFIKIKKPVLKCSVCDVTKKTKVALFQHLEAHIGTPISCKKCRQEFNGRYSYDWHLTHMCKHRSRLLLKTRYKCSECPKVFRFEVHYKHHIEAHKRNNCLLCNVTLTHHKQLVDHLLNAHSIKLERAKFRCEHCGKRYVKRINYYNHLKQHAAGKKVCMDCGLIIDNNEEYAKHVENHRAQKRWQCNKCLDRFSRRQQFLIHLKKHEIYKCLTCKESFSSKVRIFQHKQQGHEVTGLEPTLRCQHCPRAFYRKLNLQLHMRKHTDDKSQIPCKYCKVSFRTPCTYFHHLASTQHDKQSPEINQLVCESCGKQFTKKYRLAQHFRRIHSTKRKTFDCQYCDFKCNNKTNLQRHVSLHLNVKPEFVCDQCGKGFNNLATLKDHVSYIHVQARQFKCDQCDKSFKRNSELNRHRSIHSDLRPFVCGVCNAGYKRQTHLRRHEEAAHGTAPKNRRVQRLTVADDGTVVPIPIEKKKPNKPSKSKKTTSNTASNSSAIAPATGNTQPAVTSSSSNGETSAEQQVFSIVNAQSGEMFTFTVLDSDVAEAFMLNENSDNLQGLSIVDQFVNNYLPDKSVQNLTMAEFQDFNSDVAVNGNMQNFATLDPSANLDGSGNILISSRLIETQNQDATPNVAPNALPTITEFTYQRTPNDFMIFTE